MAISNHMLRIVIVVTILSAVSTISTFESIQTMRKLDRKITKLSTRVNKAIVRLESLERVQENDEPQFYISANGVDNAKVDSGSPKVYRGKGDSGSKAQSGDSGYVEGDQTRRN